VQPYPIKTGGIAQQSAAIAPRYRTRSAGLAEAHISTIDLILDLLFPERM